MISTTDNLNNSQLDTISITRSSLDPSVALSHHFESACRLVGNFLNYENSFSDNCIDRETWYMLVRKSKSAITHSKNYDSLVITLFEGINIKNELINTAVSAPVDDYGTGILAELERLTTTVQKFLGTELKGRIMGGRDVERRRLKFERTRSLMAQRLQGVRNVNWICDGVAFDFGIFTTDCMLI